ncbi:MAG: hypothetical protein H0X29_10095 [Parachlamydiaceae bacterium]|nr:hypothetical protein [Parachlamydiaceae bacterium]
MFIIDELEKKIQKHELAFQELLIKTDSLNEQVDDLLGELKVSPEQLTAYIENKENFSEENWQIIVEQRQALDEKLKTELANIRNPLKNKKTYSERIVPQHWLFVR